MRLIPIIVWCNNREDLVLVQKQTHGTVDCNKFPCVYFLDRDPLGGMSILGTDKRIPRYDIYEYTKNYGDIMKFKKLKYDDLALEYDLTKISPAWIAEEYPEYCI